MTATHDVGWTEDRVELLKKLWADGVLSASQIATRLGGGLTRNGVLGKVHREGLARSPLTPEQKAFRSQARKALTSGVRPTSKPNSSQPSREKPAGCPALPAPTDPVPPGHPVEVGRPAFFVPLVAAKPLGVLDLGDHHCRWPEGDPKDAAFRFCGRWKPEGSSYCWPHEREAHQPARSRRAA